MTDDDLLAFEALPMWCGPCLFNRPRRATPAIAIVGGDSVCSDHLDGHCARADIQLDALEDWTP